MRRELSALKGLGLKTSLKDKDEELETYHKVSYGNWL